ncbi:MAG: ABC transporter substrate-binding protein [Oscillospiraceae bacterium]|nr:ABC transporter substrate-binding protein [Oscillospiraceae bacterium]
MKKILSLLLALAMILALTACGNTNAPADEPTDDPAAEDTAEDAAEEETPAEEEAAEEDETPVEEETPAETAAVRIGSLKGPTSIGLAHLRAEAEAGESEGSYEFTLEADASALMTGIVNGDLDIALIPANAASIWYNKMEGAVTCINVNTLGVLYILSADDSIDTIEELAGKTIYLPGQGTSPDYVLQYLLSQHDMSLEDVTVEYQAEGTEVIAALTANPEGIGLLPQPAATAAQSKLEGFSVVMDLTEEWGKVCDRDLITGVTVVRTQFLNENKEAVDLFISEHNESVQYIDADLAGVAQLTEDYGIMDKAALAEKAIPLCNVTEISGENMKDLVSNYLQVLFDLNPASVGGTLPADDFYYLG